MKQPKVVFLAGGRSQRFWPFSHKNLFPVFGKPLLLHQIEAVKRSGFTDLTIVAHPDSTNLLIDCGVPVATQQGNGMAAALLSVGDQIGNGSVMVVISNDFVQQSLYDNLFKEIQNGTHNIIVGYTTPDYLPMGYLRLEGNLVKEIVEKPLVGRQPSSQVTIAAHVFQQGKILIEYLSKTKSTHDDIYEKAISGMMRDGSIFEMLPYTGAYAYLKYPWHILKVSDHFLATIDSPRISPSASIAGSASITGPVWIEDGVRVMEYAKIIGPCYIGRNTIIGNHTMIRTSHIGQQCVIGFGSDVTRSYIGDLSWLHTNYIGDSVLGENVSLGAGTVLANLRLDEGEIHSVVKKEKISTQRTKLGAIIGDNVRIGVNCSIMPGVKIGKNAAIGAGVILDQDVPDGKFCSSKQKLTMTENRFSADKTSREKFRKKI